MTKSLVTKYLVTKPLTNTSNALGQASIPAVNQYLELAQLQQLETKALLNELAITDELLADHDKNISGDKFQQLIAGLLKLSQDELFGLHTAQYVQPGSYSVLGFIMMSCETLGEAITKIQPFEKLVGDMGTTTLAQQENSLSIGWSCIFPDQEVRRHMIDNVLASWLTFARYLTNNKGKPIKVLLTRPEPNLEQCYQYQKVFNCPVIFNQQSNEIIFNKSLLTLPLNKGNKQLLPTLEQHAQQLISGLQQPLSFVQHCQQLLEQNLSVEKTTQQDIARQLNISTKTLQRRLKAENSNFKTLLNNVRLTKAKECLDDLSLTGMNISQKLGFAESRSFYRWFQKQTGKTPGQYRKENNT
ncbi:MAG: AraC family transcriptional regulator [Gammaproteobacteria bacterium]|nr:MAG: AraC family transcriptional regulator [Gammaproteobacteria bacterium]